MKVAYVSPYNSNDINQFSGLGYYMYKCIADQGVEVILINSEVPLSKWLKLKAHLIKLMFGKRYQLDRDPGYLKKVAAKAEKQLNSLEYDLVLSPGSLPVTYLNTDKPIVFWTDSTYDSLVNYYPEWHNLSSKSVKNGNKAEQIAIDKASLIFYTSDWALENAVEKYGASRDKVKQVPNGPNLELKSNFKNVEDLICNRQENTKVNLLFVGIDWDRKGGDIAIDTVIKLREKGVNAILTVVGINYLPKFDVPYIEYHPFINKNVEDGVDKLNELYEQATFFVLPTKAECFAVVFAEAGSHALPVITTNIGGCASAIKNGYNGYCLDLDNFSSVAAEKIFTLIKSPGLYRQYSLNAFENFKNELNWEVVGRKVVGAIKELLKKKSLYLMIGVYKVFMGVFKLYTAGIA